MDGHLTFEEMAEVAFLERLEDKNRALLLKTQSHIIECIECKRTYDKLISFNEITDRLVYDTAIKSGNKATALRYIRKLFEDAIIGKDRFFDWMDKIISGKNEMYMTAKSHMGRITELVAQNNDMFDFGYAVPMGARGEANKNPDKTALIDDYDADNRIFVDGNDCLTIQLRAENFSRPDPNIILVSDSGEVYFSGMLSKGNIYTARFERLGEGTYQMYFE